MDDGALSDDRKALEIAFHTCCNYGVLGQRDEKESETLDNIEYFDGLQ